MNTKICSKCRQDKPLTEFNTQGKLNGKPRSQCKECDADYGKWLRKHRPDKVKQNKKRYNQNHPEQVKRWFKRHKWKKKGLSPDMIEQTISTHNNLCDLCGEPSDSLVVDHCHTTKMFRGLLCNGCNIGLGHFRDNPLILSKAITYLKKHRKA